MYNYNAIIDDDTYTMRFVPNHDDPSIIDAYQDGGVIGQVTLKDGTFSATTEPIFMQYKYYQTRPEFAVGKPVTIEGQTMEELMTTYEELFIGAYILAKKCPIIAGKPAPFTTTIDWLRTTDFYTAPASTKYHDSVPGGLLVHSLRVYNKMIELHNIPSFNKVNIAEATIVALAHDWCKIGYYESYERNVKNEATGKWEKVPAYKVNQKGLPLGHGTTSLYILMKLMRITDEQALAVRHHMGVWNVSEPEKSELQRANAHFPMVYLIQFADQLACVEY